MCYSSSGFGVQLASDTVGPASEVDDRFLRFLAKPQPPQQPPMRGEGQADRVAPPRYATD